MTALFTIATYLSKIYFPLFKNCPINAAIKVEKVVSFRPDLTFFVNGLYLGYSELKANFSNQTAKKNGRGKVAKDYFEAVRKYYEVFDQNPHLSESEKAQYRKDFLKIFEKAIHITTTDIAETYVIRTIDQFFDDALATCRAGKYDLEDFKKKVSEVFKPYPLLEPDADKKGQAQRAV